MSDNEEYPEYFIIRADNFTTKDIAPNWMEQWMNYLNTGTISPEDDAPGLPQAREALIFDKMPPAEKNTATTSTPSECSRTLSMTAAPPASPKKRSTDSEIANHPIQKGASADVPSIVSGDVGLFHGVAGGHFTVTFFTARPWRMM